MESKKIESIFEDYLNKENTNYALLISGKWGSGKTYLWKNVLKNIAVNEGFRPIYISLNGIESIKEAENHLFSSLLPISDKLQKKGIKDAIKLFRNTANIAGKIFGRGTQLIDFTKGIKINLDVSKTVLCFDDLERCAIEPERILGLINEYTEHKNAKVIIFSAEEEIKDKSNYNRIKEKVVGRILNYTANYNELFNNYIESLADLEFHKFLNSKSNMIIHFFKNQNIQNLRTFGFYLDNLSQLYKYYKDESEIEIERMLFFTAVISNEFKNGELTIANLKDKKGIDDFMLFFDLDNVVVDGTIGISTFNSKVKEDESKEKSYKEKFIEKYLNNQNEKDMYLFSGSIYEFVLSGYLDTEKLKNEIETRNGKDNNTKEDKAYNMLMGYNFRILENDEFDNYLTEVLEYAEQGKYNMYNYQIIFNNLSFYRKIGSLEIEEKELVTRLTKGLDISKNISDIDFRLMLRIRNYKDKDCFNDVEKKIFELHDEKVNNKKRAKSNEIFEVLDKDLVEIEGFFNKVLNSENSLFEFIDPNIFFTKLVELKNKNLLILSNCLYDNYKKHYFKFAEKELPFFETLKELIVYYCNQNDLKNPKKIILEELLGRIGEIIAHFTVKIKKNNT